jgi:hypothetical protein
MTLLQECPACGRPTPEENLRCIYCGERLPVQGGVLGSFRFGVGRAFFLAAAILLVLFFLWLYLR